MVSEREILTYCLSVDRSLCFSQVRQQKADAIKLADTWKERYESSATGGQAAALNRCQRELIEARSEIKLKSALFDEKARIANETATFLANRHAEDVRIIETERLLYQHKQEGFEAMERMWTEKSKEYEDDIANLSRGDKCRTSLTSIKEQEYLRSIEQLSQQIAEHNKMIEQAKSVFEVLNAEKLAMASEIQRKDTDLQNLAKELHQARASEIEAKNYMQDANLSLDGAKRKIASLLKKQGIESDERQTSSNRVHELELQLKRAETEVNDLREQLVKSLLEQHQPDSRRDIVQEEGEEEMNVEAAEEARSIARLPGRNTPAPESLSTHSGPFSPKNILSPSSETRFHSNHPLSSPRTRAPSSFHNLFSPPSGPASPISRNNSKTISTQSFRLPSQPPEPSPFLMSSPRASKRSSALEIIDREQVDDSRDIGKGAAFKRMRLESDRDDRSNRRSETIPGSGASSFPMVFSPNSKRKMSSSPDEVERRVKKG
ncbi:hypothetical protein [Phaffia rhodozyma]|uniref:Uncharacterized protein n=1 Tax=Phaffia rhodozyma TaxID=264483 RepID=A0A0F7SNS3_PHARH|nr:hypothetical protein [Phaffia rhodozyma]